MCGCAARERVCNRDPFYHKLRQAGSRVGAGVQALANILRRRFCSFREFFFLVLFYDGWVAYEE